MMMTVAELVHELEKFEGDEYVCFDLAGADSFYWIDRVREGSQRTNRVILSCHDGVDMADMNGFANHLLDEEKDSLSAEECEILYDFVDKVESL